MFRRVLVAALTIGALVPPIFCQEQDCDRHRISLRGTLERTAIAGGGMRLPRAVPARTWDLEGRGPGAARALAISPGGSRLASVSESELRIWDARTGERLARWPGEFRALVFLDERTILSASESRGLEIRGQDMAAARRIGGRTRGEVEALARTPDGRRVLVAREGGSIDVHDVGTGECVATWLHSGSAANGWALDPRGRWFVLGSSTGFVFFHDLSDGRMIRFPPPRDSAIRDVAFDRDGTRLAIATEHGRLEVWNAASGTLEEASDGPRGIVRLAWAGDEIVAGLEDGSIEAGAPGAGTQSLAGHRGPVSSLVSFGDASCVASAGDDGTVRLWDIRERREVHSTPGHLGPIHAIAGDPRGEWFATVGADGRLRIWDAADGREVRAIRAEGASTLAVDPASRRIVTGGEDGQLRLHGPITGREIRVLGRAEGEVVAIAVSPDGATVASAHRRHYARVVSCVWVDPELDPGEVFAWDLSAGTGPRSMGSYGDRPLRSKMGWSEGRPVVLGVGGGKAKFVDPRGDDALAELHWMGSTSHGWAGAVAGDGRWAVVASYRRLARIDVENGSISALADALQTWEGVATSKDGTRIATIGSGWLAIRDSETLAVIDAIPIDGTPTHVAFAGEVLAVVCADSTIHLFRPRPRPGWTRIEGLRALDEGRAMLAAYLEALEDHDEADAEWLIERSQARKEVPDRSPRTRYLDSSHRMQSLAARGFEAFERAFAILPADARALAGRAWVFHALGDLRTSAELVDWALSLSPQAEGARELRAKLRLEAREFEGCLEDTRRCPRAGTWARSNREVEAKALFNLGRLAEAASAFEELAAGAPRFEVRAVEARRMAAAWQEELAIRREEAERDDLPRVRFSTPAGEFVLELFEDWAPNTVANFVDLVETGAYDEASFGKVDPDREACVGISRHDTTNLWESGFMLRTEVDGRFRCHFHGTVSMIGDWPVSSGSRFRIALAPLPDLDGREAAFGRVVSGMDVLQRLEPGMVIERAVILRKRDRDYEPDRIR